MEIINLNIQNLCCNRCKTAVMNLLTNFGVLVIEIRSGVVVIQASKSLNQSEIANLLQMNGFYLLNDRETSIVNQIKCYLFEYLENKANEKNKMSDYLIDKLQVSYPYLSKIFSKLEKTTIEKYFISMKIEKAKEMISLENLTLSEIAYELSYSSVQALSQQFKTVVGLTVKDFRTVDTLNSAAS